MPNVGGPFDGRAVLTQRVIRGAIAAPGDYVTALLKVMAAPGSISAAFLRARLGTGAVWIGELSSTLVGCRPMGKRLSNAPVNWSIFQSRNDHETVF